MAKTNVPNKPIYTHEGAKAKHINAYQNLRRSVLSCLLWESEFYEGGESIAARIARLVPQVSPVRVSELAVEARDRFHLRHVPLWLVREMARNKEHRSLVGPTLAVVIQRPDELAEFLSLYWKDGKQPLSSQVKKGLAAAFTKFSECQLAKYDRSGAVKLRDVLFLCHAKPKNAEQDALWKKLIAGTLEVPDTWEVALSSGQSKKDAFERLISEKKLGGLAFLRNLRNMIESGVDLSHIRGYMSRADFSKVLPSRFIAAARYAPRIEPELEAAMLSAMDGAERLPDRTILLIDVSGSMGERMSAKSDMTRLDAGCWLAILLREISEDVSVWTFSDGATEIPPRRGFALRDAIVGSQPHSSTQLGLAVAACDAIPHDRLIVITDEQSHDRVPDPSAPRSYMVNVASNKNGVGYGAWKHIDGFSEAIVAWISEYERLGDGRYDD